MSRNNWLSLNLPDDVRDDLFTVADYVTSNAGSVFGDASITFNPMKKEDVHITAVFIGDGLHRLKYQPLADFHSQLSQMGTGEYELRFKEFSLFPPEKNNLIVAKFTADKKLYTACDNIAAMGEKVGLADLKKKQCFEPHVTLGKIGATKDQVAKLCKNGLSMPPMGANALQFRTDGVYLCGATPPQGFFDWHITFQ